MAYFRKKPVVIQAFPVSHLLQDAAHNWQGLPKCISDAYERGEIIFMPKSIDIKTLEGRMVGDLTDWIIKGVKGELYPCKDDIFRATYDPENDPALKYM